MGQDFLYSSLKPLIFNFDPETAHEFIKKSALLFNPSVARFWRKRFLEQPRSNQQNTFFEFQNLKFEHPIGLAAGFDKNAEMLWPLYACGFSYIELGTVTPLAQEGNPKPRIFRLTQHDSIINRMGFNNVGLAEFKKNFERQERPPIPIGMNIGKNKLTPSEKAFHDYFLGVMALSNIADYLVFNLSSPNTPGLRGLLDIAFLNELEKLCVETDKPIFVKVPPLADQANLDEVLSFVNTSKFAGVIATNTTVQRTRVGIGESSETGGLSGKLLKNLSLETLKHIHDTQRLNQKILIGVGGISNALDLKEFLNYAPLVQIYTALIYQGPFFIFNVLRDYSQISPRNKN